MAKFEVEDFTKKMIEKAAEGFVQDIYLQPVRQEHYRLSFRDIGEERLFAELAEAHAQSLMAHLKFLAGMNVGEHRRSQLGACDYLGYRLRLSSVGNLDNRESLVIRLHYEGLRERKYWLEAEPELAELYSGRGLYLFSGPVASGKTSLMYALAERHFSGRQVIAIEDPVELIKPDFLQLQLNPAIGNDYEILIKLALRQRPDLLIVGEIRDSETAKAVQRAALIGLPVFSTIHANFIPGVLERLKDLGLSELDIQQSLKAIVYQRLLAGGGLIEIAKGNYREHSPQNWNQKLDQLVEQGHLGAAEAEVEKIDH